MISWPCLEHLGDELRTPGGLRTAILLAHGTTRRGRAEGSSPRRRRGAGSERAEAGKYGRSRVETRKEGWETGRAVRRRRGRRMARWLGPLPFHARARGHARGRARAKGSGHGFSGFECEEASMRSSSSTSDVGRSGSCRSCSCCSSRSWASLSAAKAAVSAAVSGAGGKLLVEHVQLGRRLRLWRWLPLGGLRRAVRRARWLLSSERSAISCWRRGTSA